MSDKDLFSLEDFDAKVEWEGGAYEAAVGYGLKSNDLAEPYNYPELVTAWDNMVASPTAANVGKAETELALALMREQRG